MPSRRKKLLRPYKPLHPLACEQTDEDFKYMEDLLKIDRRSLARFQDPELNTMFKCPPLMAAYYKKHYKCMQFLLAQGAKPGGLNQERFTTMHVCLHNKDLTAVTLLLEHGFDLTCAGNWRDSYLSWSLGNPSITYLLLQHGAETDCLHNNDTGNAYYVSNLSRALQNGHSECAKLLLIFGAITDYRIIPNIHRSTIYLNSFAHCVIRASNAPKAVEKQKAMFEMLRQFGVDLYEKNEVGLTVLEVLQFQSGGEEKASILANSLIQILNEPMSLLNLSRIVIRKSMGRDIMKKLEILKELHILPTLLLKHLYCHDD